MELTCGHWPLARARTGDGDGALWTADCIGLVVADVSADSQRMSQEQAMGINHNYQLMS